MVRHSLNSLDTSFSGLLIVPSCLPQHSFFYMTKAAVPHLQKVKGSIVNNASVCLPNPLRSLFRLLLTDLFTALSLGQRLRASRSYRPHPSTPC